MVGGAVRVVGAFGLGFKQSREPRAGWLRGGNPPWLESENVCYAVDGLARIVLVRSCRWVVEIVAIRLVAREGVRGGGCGRGRAVLVIDVVCGLRGCMHAQGAFGGLGGGCWGERYFASAGSSRMSPPKTATCLEACELERKGRWRNDRRFRQPVSCCLHPSHLIRSASSSISYSPILDMSLPIAL